jgi:Tfp pilus assembly protein PilO
MQIKNRQQLLIVAALAVIVLFVGNLVIIEPLTQLWKKRGEQVVALRKKVEAGNQLIKREAGLRGRWDQMRTNTLPNNPSLAEQQVLKAFDQWSQESRVSVTSITPQWKHDADDYMTLGCRVEASGNLASLSRFLYEIEKDPMALRLDSMEITARDKDGQQLALGLQISGLVLNSPEGSK